MALVVTVPIVTVAVMVAAFIKDQSMRLGVSPVNRANEICATGVYVRPEQGLQATAYERWGGECGADGDDLMVPPLKVDDIRQKQAGESDLAVTVIVRHYSHLHVPQLSLWPFTDPDSIRFGVMRSDGSVEGSRPISKLGLDDDSPITLKDRAPEYEAMWLKVRDELTQSQRSLNHQVLALAGGALALIGLFTVVAWVATGRVLRPVEEIRLRMADITEHDLTGRVAVPRARNEIARLASTVNATLDRLQAAVEENRRFVADASHELRSPIAALRTELEIATAHPDQADWPTVVDAALADTERLQHLATDLLLLARLDHTTIDDNTVDLATLVREHTAHRRTRHTLTAEVPDHAVLVRGSRTLLDRLLGNLLDNADRHATTAVTVHLAEDADQAVLEVIDDGPGIPPADRDRVFTRFTRLDDARTRDTGGTGLGLPIARRIAATHHGTLHAAAHTGGARFVAVLPLLA
ncbi:ATP-binding protein [Actinosynnema sp. NPDC023658]|uniref:sensor histidine kinase n=1 Tax=Actinosynnema sp. NPDC023658 TaxID=3155465 RepID=UPI0033E6AFA6